MPRARRGQALGTVFGLAVFGFVVGPMFGGVADVVGIRPSFGAVALVAAGLAAAIAAVEAPPRERRRAGAIARALHDRAFVGGLWLNTLPALFFGTLDVLVPLHLDSLGYGALAIAAVFFTAGLVEVGVNPVVGRISDRHGRLLPVRVALAASIVVAVAIAFATEPLVVAALVVAASITFGGFFTPGMALVADRAEHAGLAQGDRVRRDEHRVGDRSAGRACDRRGAGPGVRRCRPVPALRRAVRAHARRRVTRRRAPAAGLRPSGRRGVALEHPVGVERPQTVVAPVDEHEITSTRIHRQA